MDLKYTVDTAAVLQLFMGNRLYYDKRVFLREPIHNAVDACSMRKLADKAYVPAISIAFNDDISRINSQDNGIGMDRQWLEKYFLSIGISFYQSDEVKSVNRDPRIDIGFISQFGIGFLSSFLVAEKIVIKTRKGTSRGLMITITSLRDYFDVRPLDDDSPASAWWAGRIPEADGLSCSGNSGHWPPFPGSVEAVREVAGFAARPG